MVKGVFDGTKVVDFSWLVAGPEMAKILADHGAEVIRIESSLRPDDLRTHAPFKDNTPGLNRAPFFANYNNNKYGVTLNLKHSKGIEVAKRIIVWADVVVENFTPGVMKKWGLDYERIKEINPGIIMISTSNQGQTGPHAPHPGFGLQLPGLCGLVELTGWPDRGPVTLSVAYTDTIAPYFGTTAVIAALDYRRRTGQGQYLDLSQYETSVHFLAPLFLDYATNGRITTRIGNKCPYAAPHNVYPCRGEDSWVAITVFTDEEWKSFCQVLSAPVWTKDAKFATLQKRKENEYELDRLVGEWTINFTAEEVMKTMQLSGIAAGKVNTCRDISEDQHLEYRHHFWSFEHPEMGHIKIDGPPFRLSQTPAEPRMPPPCLGEHNHYVYTKMLGMSDEEFIELLQEGVFD